MNRIDKIALSNKYPNSILILSNEDLRKFDISSLYDFGEGRIEYNIARDIEQNPNLLYKSVLASEGNGIELCLLKWSDPFKDQIAGVTYLDYENYILPRSEIINDSELLNDMKNKEHGLNIIEPC